MFVVCHMLTSLDGKIDGAFFSAPETAPALAAYAGLRGFYVCPATLYGTTTMLGGYADGPAPALLEKGQDFPRQDHVDAEGLRMGNFIISVDPRGELGWSGNTIEKKGRAPAHVVEVLTEQVSDAYLSYLRRYGISYVFAGKERLDCALLLSKLQELFGIDRLMLAGGGLINGSFLQADLIDELSIVVAPVADGNTTSASIFECASFLPPHGPTPFALKEARPMEGGALWLCYARR